MFVRALHVRVLSLNERFTATFTLPLLYASRILSDASEFPFISNKLATNLSTSNRGEKIDTLNDRFDKIFILMMEREREKGKEEGTRLKG